MEAGALMTAAVGGAGLTRQSSGSGVAPPGGGFEAVLRRVKANETPEEKARRAAEDLVAVALVQPVLKSLRSTNQAAPPFAPGDFEKTFGQMADAQTAQRLVSAGRWGLVDAVARKLLKQSSGAGGQATGGGLVDGGSAAGKPAESRGPGGAGGVEARARRSGAGTTGPS